MDQGAMAHTSMRPILMEKKDITKKNEGQGKTLTLRLTCAPFAAARFRNKTRATEKRRKRERKRKHSRPVSQADNSSNARQQRKREQKKAEKTTGKLKDNNSRSASPASQSWQDDSQWLQKQQVKEGRKWQEGNHSRFAFSASHPACHEAGVSGK